MKHPPTEPQPLSSPVATRATNASDAPSADAAVDASPMRAGDDEFRAAVLRFAAAKQIRVASWGTLHLDGTATSYRYAGLAASLIDDGHVHRLCAQLPSCRAGYLIEESPERYWYVATSPDVPVFREPYPLPVEPQWDVLTDTWILHYENHNHGVETVAFGLRGGKLVVLDDEDYNSRVDDSHDVDYDAKADTLHHRYATDGVCETACPALAGYRFRGIEMYVQGPGRTVDVLP